MIDESAPDTPRWHLRFANFKAALTTLREGVALLAERGLSQLERDGLIQRFEYTWEQSWKVMRDYLFEVGVQVQIVNAANVTRAAFQAGLITDGDAWVRARKDRNVVSHEHGADQAARVVAEISATYLPLLNALEGQLEQELAAGN